MRVLFIYPEIHPAYPLQIGLLSAYIKRNGHEAKLLDFDSKSSVKPSKDIQKKIKEEIVAFKPDLIAFSCYEMSFTITKNICHFIKKRWPKLPTIVGGYYPTTAPDEVIKTNDIDIICLGEGERPLTELLSSMAIGKKNRKINNLWFKVGKKVFKNEVGPLIEELDTLPFPDREMLDYQAHLNLEKVGSRDVKVMAARGCPYQCTYCSNTALRAIYPNKNKYLRYRSPQNVINELKELKSKYEFELVGFHDDNLTIDHEWLKEFCRLYKKEINLPFYCAARVETCSDDILRALKKAGCYMLLFGVESGDENYRRKIMKRYMTDELIINTFTKVRKLGMRTWSFTMVGLPFENWKMILRTFWLNWRCRPDMIMASIYYPIKGTELGDVCYKNGWVDTSKKEGISSLAKETCLRHPNFSPIEIKFAKYLNLLPAARSPYFWDAVRNRVWSTVIPISR